MPEISGHWLAALLSEQADLKVKPELEILPMMSSACTARPLVR